VPRTPRKILNDPKHWLARAKEARRQATEMRDPEARRQMLAIAEGFERVAQLIAKRQTQTLH
jgi:hypothetical protein